MTASIILCFSIFDLFSMWFGQNLKSTTCLIGRENLKIIFPNDRRGGCIHSQVKSHGWCTNTSKVGLHTRDTHSYTFFSLFKKEKTIFGRHRTENPSLWKSHSQNEPPPICTCTFLTFWGIFLFLFWNESLTRNLVAFEVLPPLIRQRFLEKYLKDSHLTKITR